MRLIDADALCGGLVSNHPVAIYAKNAPTIDAVPVVRCKDCQWKELCLETLEYKGESGFCSKGERKDDE